MRTLGIFVSVIAAVILLIAAVLFYAVSRLATEQMFANETVLLLGDKGMFHGTAFGYVQIGSVGTPYQPEWTVGLRFPDGREVDFNDESYVQYLLEHGTQRADAKPVWPSGSVRVVDSRCAFVIHGKRILQMTYLMDVSESVPAISIRTSRCTQWIQFPLSRDDAIKVFGKPEKEQSYYRL